MGKWTNIPHTPVSAIEFGSELGRFDGFVALIGGFGEFRLASFSAKSFLRSILSSVLRFCGPRSLRLGMGSGIG